MLHPFLQIVLDSDDPLFGGFCRIDHRAEYFSSVRNFSQDTNLVPLFSASLPCCEQGY